MQAAAKLSLFIVGMVAGATSASIRAEAQNYPWCAEYSGDSGGAMNCGFVSYDQCMLTVRGMGGFCVVNTQYHPPGPVVPLRYQAPKHHVAKNY
jgi:hypothetical protein